MLIGAASSNQAVTPPPVAPGASTSLALQILGAADVRHQVTPDYVRARNSLGPWAAASSRQISAEAIWWGPRSGCNQAEGLRRGGGRHRRLHGWADRVQGRYQAAPEAPCRQPADYGQRSWAWATARYFSTLRCNEPRPKGRLIAIRACSAGLLLSAATH